MFTSEAAAEYHDLTELRVLINMIGFRKVSEGLVDKDTGKHRVKNHGIGASFYLWSS
jgi:hypothetical protein